MRIFLDDERPAPAGWTRAYWPIEVIALLEKGGVTEVGLDHDLGDDERGTGYDVILWVEEAVATRGFVPPKLVVLSASILRRPVSNGVEFLVVTHWESIESIRAFAGAEVETAVVPPEVQEMMLTYDRTVRHYDVIT